MPDGYLLGHQNDWNSNRDLHHLTISISHQWKVFFSFRVFEICRHAFETLKLKLQSRKTQSSIRERQKIVIMSKKQMSEFLFFKDLSWSFSIHPPCLEHSKQFIVDQCSLVGFTLKKHQKLQMKFSLSYWTCPLIFGVGLSISHHVYSGILF